MKLKKSVLLLFLICITSEVSAQVARDLMNPQSHMVGARYLALGITNPAVLGDINGLFINPAVVSGIDYMPFSFTNQRVLGFFDYKVLNSSFPFDIPIPFENKTINQKVAIGLSYGSSTLEDIPETILENEGTKEKERVRPIGYFSSGFKIYQASIGASLYEMAGFNSLSMGAAMKIFNQFVKDQNRYAMSLDIGGIAVYHLNLPYLPYVNRMTVGGSILNLFSSQLEWADIKSTSYLPFQIFVGTGFDLLDDTVSVYINNSIEGIAFSGEWYLNNFVFRGSSNFKTFSLGTSLLFENITGIAYQDYSIRLDYSYAQNIYPFSGDPTHALSVSILGESKPRTPQILVPSEKTLTREKYFTLSGVGPKNTAIRIFNNGSMTRTAQANRLGNWRYPSFPLKEGNNEISVSSYILDKDISPESEKVTLSLIHI